MTFTESDLIDEISGNALLHLYLHMADSERFTPSHRRNEILVKYLKPRVKAPRYKLISKRLKTLVLAGQRHGSLEQHLLNLRTVVSELEAQPDSTDQKQFFGLFDRIKYGGQWNAAIFKPGMKTEAETVYVLEDHLTACFDNQGNQIAPVSILARTTRVEELMTTLAEISRFKQEVIEYNQATQDVHLHLHPHRNNS